MSLPLERPERRRNNLPVRLESGDGTLDSWAGQVADPSVQLIKFYHMTHSMEISGLYRRFPAERRAELSPRWRIVLEVFSSRANRFAGAQNFDFLSVKIGGSTEPFSLYWASGDELMEFKFPYSRNDSEPKLNSHLMDLANQVNNPERHQLTDDNTGLHTAFGQYLEGFFDSYLGSFGKKRAELLRSADIARKPEDFSWVRIEGAISGFQIIASDLVSIVNSKVPYSTKVLRGEMDGYLRVLERLCRDYASAFNVQQAKKDAKLAGEGNLYIPQANIGVVRVDKLGVAGFEQVNFRFGTGLYGLGIHEASLEGRVRQLIDFLSSPDWQKKSGQFPEQDKSIRQYLAALQI